MRRHPRVLCVSCLLDVFVCHLSMWIKLTCRFVDGIACAQRGGFRTVGERCERERSFKGSRRRSERVLGWG